MAVIEVSLAEADLLVEKPKYLVLWSKTINKGVIEPVYRDMIGCWYVGDQRGQFGSDPTHAIQMHVLVVSCGHADQYYAFLCDRYDEATRVLDQLEGKVAARQPVPNNEEPFG